MKNSEQGTNILLDEGRELSSLMFCNRVRYQHYQLPSYYYPVHRDQPVTKHLFRQWSNVPKKAGVGVIATYPVYRKHPSPRASTG